MPSLRFTSRALDALKLPVDSPFIEYWDLSRPGFGLRLSSGGRKVWVVRYKVRDTKEQDRATLGLYESMALVDARLAASEYLDAAQRGTNLKTQKQVQQKIQEQKKADKDKTFGWLVHQYLNDSEVLRKKSYREDKRILEKEVLQFWEKPGTGWAKRPWDSITKTDVRELLDKTLIRTQKERFGKPGKGVHANRVFSRVRRVFNYGLEKDLITSSPCLGLKRPLKNEESRDNVLTTKHLRLFLSAIEKYRTHEESNDSGVKVKTKKYIVAIMKLMILTAQRGGEVRAISWVDVDFDRNVWTIPKEKTKNGKSNVIPLSTQAVKVINEFIPYRNESSWIFPSPVNAEKHIENVQKAIQRFRELAEVPCVGHDFRRTTSSHMAELGVLPHVIERILNHSDGKDVAQIYNRYAYEAEKRDALQMWGNHLDKILIGSTKVSAEIKRKFK